MNFPVLYQIPVNEKKIYREFCSSILIMASAFNFKTDNYLINETNKTAYEQMYFRIFTRNNKTHLNIQKNCL